MVARYSAKWRNLGLARVLVSWGERAAVQKRQRGRCEHMMRRALHAHAAYVFDGWVARVAKTKHARDRVGRLLRKLTHLLSDSLSASRPRLLPYPPSRSAPVSSLAICSRQGPRVSRAVRSR